MHKALDSVSKHPLVTTAVIIFTILAGLFGVVLWRYTTFTQPIDQFRENIAQTVISMRLKIVDVSEGCKATNSYSQALLQNNIDRLTMVSNLLGIAKGGNIEKKLGLRAQQQLACFVKYNDMLSLRSNICNGEFLTERQMIEWEERIIYDLHHKSDKKINCPYGIKGK